MTAAPHTEHLQTRAGIRIGGFDNAGVSACGAADREETQRIDRLVDEFNHRIRNMLATVQALVRQTRSANVEDYRSKLMSRIADLSQRYEVVGCGQGKPIGLTELLAKTLDLSGEAGTHPFDLAGPEVALEPRLALALHLVVHELATNAKKHGALTIPAGWIKVRWEVVRVPGAGRTLAILWSEHGGPEVRSPDRKGYGSRLIDRALEAHGQVELSFRPQGVACRILITLDGPPRDASH